jgi:hypothetical protein
VPGLLSVDGLSHHSYLHSRREFPEFPAFLLTAYLIRGRHTKRITPVTSTDSRPVRNRGNRLTVYETRDTPNAPDAHS